MDNFEEISNPVIFVNQPNQENSLTSQTTTSSCNYCSNTCMSANNKFSQNRIATTGASLFAHAGNINLLKRKTGNRPSSIISETCNSVCAIASSVGHPEEIESIEDLFDPDDNEDLTEPVNTLENKFTRYEESGRDQNDINLPTFGDMNLNSRVKMQVRKSFHEERLRNDFERANLDSNGPNMGSLHRIDAESRRDPENINFQIKAVHFVMRSNSCPELLFINPAVIAEVPEEEMNVLSMTNEQDSLLQRRKRSHTQGYRNVGKPPPRRLFVQVKPIHCIKGQINKQFSGSERVLKGASGSECSDNGKQYYERSQSPIQDESSQQAQPRPLMRKNSDQPEQQACHLASLQVLEQSVESNMYKSESNLNSTSADAEGGTQNPSAAGHRQSMIGIRAIASPVPLKQSRERKWCEEWVAQLKRMHNVTGTGPSAGGDSGQRGSTSDSTSECFTPK